MSKIDKAMTLPQYSTSVLRQITIPSGVRVQVALLWTKSFCLTYKHLSKNVIREVCAYLRFQNRPAIFCSRGFMHVFDPQTLFWQEFDTLSKGLFPSFSGRAAAVCIGDMQIFVCGACIAQCNAYTVRNDCFMWDNRQVFALPNMHRSREHPALIFDLSTMAVLVFGGRGGATQRAKRSCESFDLLRSQWTKLPKMHTRRSHFNACRHDASIFLCHGCDAPCEVFNIPKCSFTVLPHFSQPTDSYLFSAIYKDLLVIVYRKNVWKWNVKSGTKLVSTVEAGVGFSKMIVDSPVVFDGVVYSFDVENRMTSRFDLRKGKQVTD